MMPTMIYTVFRVDPFWEMDPASMLVGDKLAGEPEDVDVGGGIAKPDPMELSGSEAVGRSDVTAQLEFSQLFPVVVLVKVHV